MELAVLSLQMERGRLKAENEADAAARRCLAFRRDGRLGNDRYADRYGRCVEGPIRLIH